MSVLWKKIKFNKGQSNCEAIIIAAWGLGQSPTNVCFLNIFKVIKWFTMALKIMKRPKKIYQFINNLFFLTNIPTSGGV